MVMLVANSLTRELGVSACAGSSVIHISTPDLDILDFAVLAHPHIGHIGRI
jgi:hypothetical protein